ncbi:hypothetical protein ACIP93_24490 [Streptomyces sp. NPDC088745]|uniref:hypothetical protein n=1 Tax=Streptomyces sp. NPDC088745 TaxID=3365884 RepID=UPI003807FA31
MTGTEAAGGDFPQETAAARQETAGEDELFVLTAVLLTPAQFPAVLGDDFPEACGALGLAPDERGYGLVLGQDGSGARWTVVVDDVSLVAVAIAAWDCGMEYDLSPPERSVVAALPGWPLALAVAAPGVPAPHDPELPDGSPDGPLLTPPDTGEWGPAQRRLGADEIARQWATWRGRLDEQSASDTFEGTEGELHPLVRRVIDALHGYVADPPPAGRVRSAFAPGGARTLRADGPGWSFVARTDDIAFLLLDDEPGELLPVGRGAELPGLLESLEKLAARPS